MTRVLRSCAIGLRDDAVTTVFPADCRICDGPLTAWNTAPVCDECLAQVEPQKGALCGICGEALGMESARFAAAMGISACTLCRLAPPEFTRAVAYAAYADEVRELLHLFKYQRMSQLADRPLGQWLARTILSLHEEAGTDLMVVAVPLFASRERARGFNQSAALADAAIVHLKKMRPGWRFSSAHQAMSRVRDTEAQSRLLPGQRRRNLRGAFRVADPSAVHGRDVLLVDDIMTTGATARECARMLKRAGAARVFVATLARAQAEGTGLATSSQGVAMWDAVIERSRSSEPLFRTEQPCTILRPKRTGGQGCKLER